MVGRSLFSLLAVAAVAIQSCAASFIEGGYRIQVSDSAPLSVSEVRPGAFVEVSKYGQVQEWELRPSDRPEYFKIALTRSPFYAVPTKEGRFVELSFDSYEWRLRRVGDGRFIIERTDTYEPWALSISPLRIFPPRAATEPEEERPPQTWSIVRVGDFQQETRNQCGPRRLSRNSFYLQ